MDGYKAVEYTSDMKLKGKGIGFRNELLAAIYRKTEINGAPKLVGNGKYILMIIPYTSPNR